MKEALTSPYNKIVFRETFNSEQAVRNNGGVPTAVTISKGVGSFNGTSSYIKYNKALNGVYSVRIKAKNINPSAFCIYVDFRNSNGSGIGYITGGILSLSVSSGTAYVNGVATAIVNTTSSDIVITGMTINCFEIFLNTRYNLINWLGADVDLVEIYEGVLTPSEVKNLYRNSWAKDDIKKDLLLDYDSTNGYITDRTGKNTLTATDVSIKKTGGFYSSEFNGSTSKIDTGSDFIGTKAVTICGWIKAYSYGRANYGRIVDNGKLFFLVDGALKSLRFSSNAASEVTSAANSILLRKWYFVVAIRNVSGLAAFYIGNKTSAPVVSGENLNSGAPISGVNNVLMGGNATGSRTFYGNIPMLKVYEGILDLEQLTQIWSSTRNKIQ